MVGKTDCYGDYVCTDGSSSSGVGGGFTNQYTSIEGPCVMECKESCLTKNGWDFSENATATWGSSDSKATCVCGTDSNTGEVAYDENPSCFSNPGFDPGSCNTEVDC